MYQLYPVHHQVTVEDYNDNAPVFHPVVKTLKKKENVPDGTSLWNCTATDDDTGINRQFEWVDMMSR